MKRLFIFLLVLTFAYSFAVAQMPPESKPDEELTKEEA